MCENVFSNIFVHSALKSEGIIKSELEFESASEKFQSPTSAYEA